MVTEGGKTVVSGNMDYPPMYAVSSGVLTVYVAYGAGTWVFYEGVGT